MVRDSRGLDVVWVGFAAISMNSSVERVRERDVPGLARWSEERVHEGMTYDLWVETTVQAAEACAHQIVAAARSRICP
ncbi:phosphotransferase-like protein [Kribbella catacumbae]|uniref:phosphotransferase-like protein n=1 Tax=Kribbella catacumbae TaxID=460086 RepID=UPI003B506EF1